MADAAGQTWRAGLYAVATPIGNLADLSPRAAECLRRAAVVAAEDTRTAGLLLREAGSGARSVSLTEHNVGQRAPELVAAARDGIVALVSDAGTPVVADPGGRLVDAAHEAGVPVFAVAGPSALTAALSVSGFDGSDAHFLGFLPKGRAERRTRLTEAARTAATLVLFESPNRLAETLEDIAAALEDPPVAVSREITKLHEETVRGRASELARHFASARGEVTVAIDVREFGRGANDDAAVRAYMTEMQRAGARRSPAAAEAAKRFGVPRSVAYEAWDE